MSASSSTILSYVCPSASAPIVLQSIAAPPLQPHEVQVDVTHNGLCHTDCHLFDNDWKNSTYPLVAGHEVVGVISAVGSAVERTHKVGQRVGFGWIKDSCDRCANCARGMENLCRKGYDGLIMNGNRGGFAAQIRSAARFAYPIPDHLPSQYAAPLLCAGITVYNPLRTHITRPGMKVGVIGVGGLGHMALQFAAALGADVTAISTSDDKQDQCVKWGATGFINSTNAEQMAQGKDSFDFLLDTVSAPIDWTAFLNLLMFEGKLCVVGLPPTNITVPLETLVDRQLSVVGSIVAGRAHTLEMLQMAADKKIYPQIELWPISKINEAWSNHTNKQVYSTTYSMMSNFCLMISAKL